MPAYELGKKEEEMKLEEPKSVKVKDSKLYNFDFEKFDKQLNKAKTEAQRKEIWNSIKTSREYRKDITCCTDDLVYNVRKEARSLLAEYYNNLWW